MTDYKGRVIGDLVQIRYDWPDGKIPLPCNQFMSSLRGKIGKNQKYHHKLVNARIIINGTGWWFPSSMLIAVAGK